MVDGDANGPGRVLAQAGGLDLLQGEAASGPLLDVVLEGGALNDRAQQLGGAGGNTGSLNNFCIMAGWGGGQHGKPEHFLLNSWVGRGVTRAA